MTTFVDRGSSSGSGGTRTWTGTGTGLDSYFDYDVDLDVNGGVPGYYRSRPALWYDTTWARQRTTRPDDRDGELFSCLIN